MYAATIALIIIAAAAAAKGLNGPEDITKY
jgi:hypothetical protein